MTPLTNSYIEIHKRLLLLHGPAYQHVCPCGKPAEEWAYQHTGDPELRDVDGRFPHSEDPNDYLAMCRSCHRRLDDKKDPKEVTEEHRERGRRLSEHMNRRRRRCLQCGLIGAPGAIGNHQRWYRHTGIEDLG